MKSLTLRAGLALLCATSLAACGGGSGSLILQTRIVGLVKDGLILTNGADTSPALPAYTSSFQFPTLIGNDDHFDIKIKQMPVHTNCTLTDASNKANYITVQQPVVSCTTDSYNLGGVVNGLSSGVLVLANGRDQVSITANGGAAVNFNFPTKVADGGAYGVAVLAQPAIQGVPTGQTCTVATGTGNMPSPPAGQTGDVETLVVNCH